MSAENLLQNLIVLFVLTALFLLVYCRMKAKTLFDVIKEIKAGLMSEEDE